MTAYRVTQLFALFGLVWAPRSST